MSQTSTSTTAALPIFHASIPAQFQRQTSLIRSLCCVSAAGTWTVCGRRSVRERAIPGEKGEEKKRPSLIG